MNGKFNDKERGGWPKVYEDLELEDSCQTQEKLAVTLKLIHQVILDRLKSSRLIQKQGTCLPCINKRRIGLYRPW